MKTKLFTLVALLIVAAFALTACNRDSAGSDADVTQLVMAFMTWTLPGDTQVVQDAMNEILIPEYNIEVELLVMDSAAYQQNIRMMLTAGEQIDVMGSIMAGFTHLQQQGFLLDLEENNLLANYGSGIAAAVGQEFLDGARVAGRLYGIPTNVDHAVGRGSFVVATQYLEAIGFPVPSPNNDIIPISIAEFENILHQINEAFPDIETIRPVMPGNLGHFLPHDPLGAEHFGVLLDPANSLVVENLFTSQMFYDFMRRMYNWNQAGFISADAGADTTPVVALTSAGRLAAYFTGGKPGIVAQESGLCAQPVTVFQTGPDFMNANAAARFPWVIPHTTTSPEKAMTLMNALYTNPAISNLLIWGVEGVHYEIQPDGRADFPQGLDAGTSGWFNGVAWSLPNQFISHVWMGDDLDLYDQLRYFNQNAIQSRAFGFIFDPTPVANEFAAVTNVFTELIPGLGLGQIDPTVGIPIMNDRMEAAGLYRIIAEKQAQLDAWAAATGAN